MRSHYFILFFPDGAAKARDPLGNGQLVICDPFFGGTRQNVFMGPSDPIFDENINPPLCDLILESIPGVTICSFNLCCTWV